MIMGTLVALVSCDTTSGEPQETTDPNAGKVQVVRAIKTIEVGSKLERTALQEVMVDEDLVPDGVVSSIDDIVNDFIMGTVYSGDYIFSASVSESADFGANIEDIHEDYVVVTDYMNDFSMVRDSDLECSGK